MIIASAVAIRGVVLVLQVLGIAGKTPKRFGNRIRTDQLGRAHRLPNELEEKVDLQNIDRALDELPYLGETLHGEQPAPSAPPKPSASTAAPHMWSAEQLKKWGSQGPS